MNGILKDKLPKLQCVRVAIAEGYVQVDDNEGVPLESWAPKYDVGMQVRVPELLGRCRGGWPGKISVVELGRQNEWTEKWRGWWAEGLICQENSDWCPRPVRMNYASVQVDKAWQRLSLTRPDLDLGPDLSLACPAQFSLRILLSYSPQLMIPDQVPHPLTTFDI